MGGSYCGRLLLVDLTEGRFEEERPAEEVYRDFLGGSGLGAWYLASHAEAASEPLGPRALLGLLPGLLTGSGSLFTGRLSAVCVSPLSGAFAEANCGGELAQAIKRCGYDGIFLQGSSPRPVYLRLDDGGPELRDASALWGLDTVEARERLLEGEAAAAAGRRREPSVAVIGPAGERLSLISGLVTDGGRMAAKGGLGALMGSKQLKAIVALGSRKIPCADRERVAALSAGFAARCLPEKPEPRANHCYSCPTGCGEPLSSGAEKEGAVELGKALRLGEPGLASRLLDLLDRGGMDSISAAKALALALDSGELLAGRGGPCPTWGNLSGIETLVREMIGRGGLGEIFSDGEAAARERLGLAPSGGRGEGGGEKGGRPGGGLDPDLMALLWATGLCLFGFRHGLEQRELFGWLDAANGWDREPADYLAVGSRITRLREGIGRGQAL